jgi:hypothetical protein
VEVSPRPVATVVNSYRYRESTVAREPPVQGHDVAREPSPWSRRAGCSGCFALWPMTRPARC